VKAGKVFYVALSAMLFAFCSFVEAQQPRKIPRIGYLAGITPTAQSARIEAFRQGLRELGYMEGKTSLLSRDMPRGIQIVFVPSRLSW